jgi:putative ABC transport system permease protein
MKLRDVVRFAWRSLAGYRTRTFLMVLAMSIGVAAVVVLTSLGEGARGYVRKEFESLGTNLIVILPGRAETLSGGGGLMSGRTPRDLTLDDALALRRIRGVQSVGPLNLVSGEVWWKGRRRDAPVAGSTTELADIWNLAVAYGRFLPPQDPRRAGSFCVIGSKVRRELFGMQSPLGEWIRIGDRRFRVVGVLAPKGEWVGLNMDDLVVIPVASAQAVFNLHSLLRIGVSVPRREEVRRVREEIRILIRARHYGEEDITILTEDAVAAAFDRILLALTLALGGIATISLGVAGILIMNVMLIAVSQRTSEIGLLKAIGASPGQIRLVFFAEAALLSAVGAVVGSVLGQIGSLVIRRVYPSVPAFAPGWAILAAVVIALAMGIGFSVLPARRAAQLEPAMALARR